MFYSERSGKVDSLFETICAFWVSIILSKYLNFDPVSHMNHISLKIFRNKSSGLFVRVTITDEPHKIIKPSKILLIILNSPWISIPSVLINSAYIWIPLNLRVDLK